MCVCMCVHVCVLCMHMQVCGTLAQLILSFHHLSSGCSNSDRAGSVFIAEPSPQPSCFLASKLWDILLYGNRNQRHPQHRPPYPPTEHDLWPWTGMFLQCSSRAWWAIPGAKISPFSYERESYLPHVELNHYEVVWWWPPRTHIFECLVPS